MAVRFNLSRASILVILAAACSTAEAIDYGEEAFALADESDATMTGPDGTRRPRHGPPCALDAVSGRLVPRAIDPNQRRKTGLSAAEAPEGERPTFDPLACRAPQGMRAPPPDGGDQRMGPPPGPPPHAAIGFIYDGDDSGDLSDPEKAAMQADLVAHCSAVTDRLLTEVDLDNSGTLSEDELIAAREAREEEAWSERSRAQATDADPQARCEARRDALLEQFDANDDGAIEGTERAALRADARERFRSAIPPGR